MDRVKLVAAVTCIALAACGADLLNNAGIHAHVDDQLQNDPQAARPVDRLATNLELLVPVLGTYELDHAVYGSARPSGIVFDWLLGGLAPLALAGASFAVDGARTRSLLRWTALGLYASTRIGVLVIGNLHVSEYNDYLASRTAAPRGFAVSAGWHW